MRASFYLIEVIVAYQHLRGRPFLRPWAEAVSPYPHSVTGLASRHRGSY